MLKPYSSDVESSSGLQDLIDRAAFLSTEHQQELLDGPGQAAWDVDLPSQSFVFHSDPPTTLSCDFLGSASPEAGSWLWGWENVNGFPDGVIALAGTIRDYGEANGIPELTSAQIPLDDDTAIDIAHRLTLAAKSVSGKYAHYSGPTGGRTRVWLLLEGPAVALADPSVIRIPRVITETLDQGVLFDSRKALQSYALLRGLDTRWETDNLAHLVAPDGEIAIEFDDIGRISRMNLHAERPTPAPEVPTRRGIRGLFGR
ncbi:DUF6882 domain-containing protein [Mycobacteroides franklinii]|uniref:DUF6882 domain-containing protein n=1 Tax=Mycobacteroides franklinii TaxID=948102 RepID=UPI00195B2F42|nr:DUF6882 domain-containing protein [Mycobacteroides franklinii]